MNNIFSRASFIVIIFLYIFNPYTIIGPLGSYVSVFFAVIGLSDNSFKRSDFYCFMGLELIALVGVISSYSNNIGQWNHLLVVNLLLLNFFAVMGFLKVFSKLVIAREPLIGLVVVAILVNALIIIFEVISTDFRDIIEGFLVSSGNRDWSEGFRYRGLASSGGAALSVLFSVGVILLFYAYHIRMIGYLYLLVGLVFMFTALLVVGRTGLVLAALFSLICLIIIVYCRPKIIINLIIGFAFGFFAISVIFPFIEVLLGEKFGNQFLNYSYGFLLAGSEGIRNEGTFDVLLSYLSVMPSDFPEIIVGFGFYGGSEFSPWTDSGLARMFLSVGFPLGIIFYLLFFSLFFRAFKKGGVFLFLIFTLLAIAELKEGMLFSGYGARVFVLISLFFKSKHRVFSPVIK